VERVPPSAEHALAVSPGPPEHAFEKKEATPEQHGPALAGGLVQVPVAPLQTLPDAPGVPGTSLPLHALADGAQLHVPPEAKWQQMRGVEAVVVVVLAVLVVVVVTVPIGWSWLMRASTNASTFASRVAR